MHIHALNVATTILPVANCDLLKHSLYRPLHVLYMKSDMGHNLLVGYCIQSVQHTLVLSAYTFIFKLAQKVEKLHQSFMIQLSF